MPLATHQRKDDCELLLTRLREKNFCPSEKQMRRDGCRECAGE
jgi:hypothetical protein